MATLAESTTVNHAGPAHVMRSASSLDTTVTRTGAGASAQSAFDGRIHVLQVTQTMQIGGLERVIATICREADSTQFRMSVLALRDLGVFADELREDGFEVHRLAAREGAVEYTAALKLARFLRAHRVDVLHTHNTHAFLDGAVGALLAGVKTIIHTDHARAFPDKWRYMAAERVLSNLAYRVVGVSAETSQNLVKYLRIPERKIVTIRNGVLAAPMASDTERAAARAAIGLQPDEPAIGLCARLTGQKGVSYLIDAMPAVLRRLPGARLFLAGTGDLDDELRRQVATAGLGDRVHFLGPRDDVPALLRAFDVMALPSLWEGLPMVVLEAMAAGCPVVATAVGGLPAVITDGETGRLVPPQDSESLAAALVDVLSDHEQRHRIAVAARDLFDREYSAGFMVRAYEKLYRREA